MNLRARIYSGFAVLMVALIVVATMVVFAQRSRLVEQLDNQLASAAPLDRRAPPPPGGGQTGPPIQSPISDLYIASIEQDNTVVVRVEGQLLETTPKFDPAMIRSASEPIITLDAVDGDTTFRALIDTQPGPAGTTVIALPMDDVDDSIRRLVLALGLLALFMAAVLGMLAAWIVRLGLRPISEMTTAAAAVAAGDRQRRVPVYDGRTEAGELSAAFNEMLDQRNEAEDRLRRFVSDASHELRTPLTSVKGYLDLYAEGGFRQPGQLDDAVGRIQSEADRMAALVENLLALARFDEEQPLQPSSFDLARLCEEVVADGSVAHPGRKIDCHVEPGLSSVYLDRDKVQQLLLGLVNNALTHAPEASVDVAGSRDGDDIVVVVADDGPGMAKEQAERVFERFYRGDPARARSTGGSGLGLSIAHSIATAHGGSIDLTTSPGAGCLFTVRLPVSTPTPERTGAG